MAFRKILNRSTATAAGGQSAQTTSAPGQGLSAILRQGVTIQQDRAASLRKGVDDGLSFFNQYNDGRLKLAFDCFDEDMRNALFEVIFLLHVNDPRLATVEYTATRKDNSKGVPRYVESREHADLYLEGAPCGVKGIEMLSPVFRESFRQYVEKTFGMGAAGGPSKGDRAIVCLQSIGSIGTIGHKSGTSDLDLQVIYDLFPYQEEFHAWSDEEFRGMLEREQGWWVGRLGREKKLTRVQAQQPAVRQELSTRAARQIARSYPLLHKYLIGARADYGADLAGADGPALRPRLVKELITLVKRHLRLSQAASMRAGEALLKERIGQIQEYINDKFPQAEIYMFAMSLDMYRAGRYTSSLEFKESSGSAYELILNYETLMPGIQFSPTIPSHFLFPEAINNNADLYRSLTQFIEFQAMDIYQDVSPLLVDLGNTPDLNSHYLAQHMPAAYWEAFKASSGNLPKATLNLLRFEMLLEEEYRHTIIKFIKEPRAINEMISSRPREPQQERAALVREETGMPNWVLTELELDYPALQQDPWWLRYKALKVAFGEAGGVTGMKESQRDQISKIVDLAFALHVRISDVFTKPGDRHSFDAHREQVLVRFLDYAFPAGTGKRKQLEHIFSGEVQAVSQFETELREHFRGSLERTQSKIAQLGVENPRKKSQEVKLWHEYYLEYFEPKPNVVQKTIMHHLKFPRGRLQIGYEIDRGWFFRSLQKASQVGKRFDTFGVLDHLPEEVTLIKDTHFMFGLATCIVNGYYGILNRGTLRETRTALEFDRKHMDLGNRLDNEKAFISPDYIERMLERILKFFPYEYHHYLDFIRVDRKVQRIYVFLNLWRFGRLSFLYRDNLNTWYCDEFDHPDLHKQGQELCKDLDGLLSAPTLHESLDRFLVSQRLFVDEVELKTWVNPNSVESRHSALEPIIKERELADVFAQKILSIHPKLSRAG